MAGEIIMFGIIILTAAIAFLSIKKPRREMTAAERMAYESERGRQFAIREFNRR